MNTMKPEQIASIIQDLHGSFAVLRGRERVEESFGGSPAWQGEVLIFDLESHPAASQCYAWEVDGRVTAVLHEGPVDSPEAAVRAAIIAEYRSRK